jgi:hypothetical protein
MDAAGLPDFKGREDLLETLRVIEDTFWTRYAETSSDTEHAAMYRERTADMLKAGGAYGPKGRDIAQRVLNTPMQNLQIAGYASDNRQFWAIAARAEEISRFALAHGLSPKGYASVTAPVADMKLALYQRIEQLRAQDEAFDAAWRVLERQTSDAVTPPTRAELYDDVLFDNTGRYGFVPTDIISVLYHGR